MLRAEQKRLTEHAARFDVSLASDPFVWSRDPDGASPWPPNRATYVFQYVRDGLDLDHGLDHVNFHHLRHFAATTLAGAGTESAPSPGLPATSR